MLPWLVSRRVVVWLDALEVVAGAVLIICALAFGLFSWHEWRRQL